MVTDGQIIEFHGDFRNIVNVSLRDIDHIGVLPACCDAFLQINEMVIVGLIEEGNAAARGSGIFQRETDIVVIQLLSS